MHAGIGSDPVRGIDLIHDFVASPIRQRFVIAGRALVVSSNAVIERAVMGLGR